MGIGARRGKADRNLISQLQRSSANDWRVKKRPGIQLRNQLGAREVEACGVGQCEHECVRLKRTDAAKAKQRRPVKTKNSTFPTRRSCSFSQSVSHPSR